MAEPIPFKYGKKNSNANIPQFSIKNTDADGKENKEDYLIFENRTHEGIFKGAQTAQRHLVELTRNQFTIRSEERKEHRTRNPKAKERKEHWTRNPKAKERERIPRERESKSYTEIPASERLRTAAAAAAAVATAAALPLRCRCAAAALPIRCRRCATAATAAAAAAALPMRCRCAAAAALPLSPLPALQLPLRCRKVLPNKSWRMGGKGAGQLDKSARSNSQA